MSVASLLRSVHGYLREVTGETQYDRYVERHAEQHADQEPLSRREFERWRIDRGDEQPNTRCC